MVKYDPHTMFLRANFNNWEGERQNFPHKKNQQQQEHHLHRLQYFRRNFIDKNRNDGQTSIFFSIKVINVIRF